MISLIDRHYWRGTEKKRGENFLKRWDQFITFLMILFIDELRFNNYSLSLNENGLLTQRP